MTPDELLAQLVVQMRLIHALSTAASLQNARISELEAKLEMIALIQRAGKKDVA